MCVFSTRAGFVTQGPHRSGRKDGRSFVSFGEGPDALPRRTSPYPRADIEKKIETGGYINSYSGYYKGNLGGRAKRGVGSFGDGGDTAGDASSGGLTAGDGGIENVGGEFALGGRREKFGGGVTSREWNAREKEHYGDSYAETAPATETPTRGYECEDRISLAKESFASTAVIGRKGAYRPGDGAREARGWNGMAGQGMPTDYDVG